MKTAKDQNVKRHPPSCVSFCSCEHKQQDEIYGEHMRLFAHASAKGTKLNRYRCTVCAREKDIA